jgi:hypothetical protein
MNTGVWNDPRGVLTVPERAIPAFETDVAETSNRSRLDDAFVESVTAT